MSDCKNAEKAAVIGLFSLHRNGRAGRQGTGNDKGIPCRSGIPLSNGMAFAIFSRALLCFRASAYRPVRSGVCNSP